MRNHLYSKLFGQPGSLVTPSISPRASHGLYGCVEEIGPAGIRGWLLDCAACDTHLKVDAYLDGQVLGSGYADRPRPDISEILDRPISCEFLIPWSAMTLPPELKGMEPTAKLQIGPPANSSTTLPRRLLPSPRRSSKLRRSSRRNEGSRLRLFSTNRIQPAQSRMPR